MENVFVILVLVFLEGLLSFDNALALAAMVKPLPPAQQKKALTYGMVGAFAFRILALFCLTWILAYPWVKIVGALWLLFVAYKGLFTSDDEKERSVSGSFLWVIVMIELTDIAFSIDSILAAAAMSRVLWVVVTGGIAGIIMMRFVSTLFVKLIDVFPRLAKSAFILVAIVGVKLLAEGSGVHVEEFTYQAAFWALMAAGLGYGFTKRVR